MPVRKPLTEAGVRRPSQALTPEAPAKAASRPDREGKSQIAFWLPKEAHKQLKLAALQMDRKEWEILCEALDDWFRKQGLHRLAS